MSPSDLAILDMLPISAWKYPRVLVGIPLERTIPHADETFFPFLQIAAQGPTLLDNKHTTRIDVARNLMVAQLLRTTYTHLLMLDIDHHHPIDIVQRLSRWFLLYDNVQVVCGLNFRRRAPYDPVAGNLTADGQRPIIVEWEQGLLPFDECGAASLMVSREVFEAMDPPWFQNIYDMDDIWKNKWPGEDIYFARKCKEHGIPFYVDTTTTSPHCTTTTVTEETFRQYMADHPEQFSNAQFM